MEKGKDPKRHAHAPQAKEVPHSFTLKEKRKGMRKAFFKLTMREKRFSLVAILFAGLACLCISALVTTYALYMISGMGFQNHTSLNDKELDAPIASYIFKGWHSVSARDIFSDMDALENLKAEDGTYDMPTMFDITGYIQQKVMVQVALDEGYTVMQQDIDAEAISYAGTADYAQLAERFGTTESIVRSTMRENALTSKIKNATIAAAMDNPIQAPAQPVSGDSDQATKEYADYIILVAGDAWDATTHTWKSDALSFSNVFATIPFDGEKATYEQACVAYSAAIATWSKNHLDQDPWGDLQYKYYSQIAFMTGEMLD